MSKLVVLIALPALFAQPAPSLDSIQDLIQNGNLPEAFRQVSTVLSAHPKDAGFLNLRGVIYANQQNFPDARRDFERAVELAPSLMPAWRNLARSCQLSGAPEAEGSGCSLTAWRHVLAVIPDDPEARFSVAAIDEEQGKYAESFQELSRLSKAEAARPPALALRCADLAALNRPAEAIEAAKQLARSPDLSPNDVQPILPVLVKAGPRIALAIVALIEALDVKAPPEMLASLVVAYEQSNRPADARKTLERIAASDSSNPRHLLELARISYKMKDFDGALGYLGHARDLAPNDPQIHFLFAMVLVELKLPLDARKSLEKALALAPRNPEYNHAMGSVILNARDAASAIPFFKTYIAERPQDPRGHFALGVAYFAAGDYENCRSEMQIAVKAKETETGASYFLGRVARVDDKLDEAATYLERAIHLSPSFAEAFAELARVRLRQERMSDAKAAINRALTLDPDSFQANTVLLTIYQREHDPRAQDQAARLKTLDEERGKAMELLLRSVEVKPY